MRDNDEIKRKVQRFRPARKRVYVKVESRFDETGYMTPTSLIWGNKIIPIDSVVSFHPARSIKGPTNLPGDCYTIMINGEQKHLYFEKTDPMFTSRCGRWFVETNE